MALVKEEGKASKAYTGRAYADRVCVGGVYIGKAYTDRACTDKAYAGSIDATGD